MANQARIILLNPPTAEPSSEPLLNLAYLASVLRNNGHLVKIIDATAPYHQQTPEMIDSVITDFEPNFIGVTLTIVCIPQTYEYLKMLKKKHGIPIIAGGPHPNALPEEVLSNGADIVVIGEGEETIKDLADYFLGRKDLTKIPGICYSRSDGTFHYTPKRPLIKNLDSIPFPDFSDFPIEYYTGSRDPDSNPLFWSVFSSRGCPFNCTFCSSHNVFGRTIRIRSANNVFEEIKSIVNKFGAKKITFQDDEILCDKKRFLEICHLLIESEIKVKFTIRTRIDSIDSDVLKHGLKAGLRRISFGIESWNNDTLFKINKKYDTLRIHKGFKKLSEVNFPYISFNNIIGFPWENQEHLNNNLNEITKIPSNIAFFTDVVTPIPYPQTVLYEQYHNEFGFTNWWLDSKQNSKNSFLYSKPLFLFFAFRFFPLYNSNPYWNYSKQKLKMIDSFCWKLFKIFIKRHYFFITAEFIYIFSKLSWHIWKISPRLEKSIFFFIPNTFLLKLTQRIKFADKF